MRRLRWTVVTTAVALVAMAAPARADQTLTVAPATPVANCWPFGGSTWSPYQAAIYQNVPPFEPKAGDVLAFDLIVPNDVDIQLEIALARTTTNGGTTEAEPFRKVVSNTQTPTNPRGDAVAGNFELQFTAEQAFSFPGGGLIIRFSNPAGEFATDACDAPTVGDATTGAPSDPSGFFVARASNDPDGISPWTPFSASFAGAAFRITTFDPPGPPPPATETDPPETTITKGAPKRLDTDRVKFRFDSDEAGATFECKLKGKDVRQRIRQFNDCDSPRRYKNLDPGRYRFKVRAIDAAGKVDPTPAKDRFRVVD
jgi:hypothetical protein